ncbi:hypothetical protein HNP38_001265 [Chryseobacterium defluvii]|uniref:SUKH-4 immunity protein of toxin-antitoxin system n=1 Tax=Chryseobacterium defluvii TaxID=160396 RepID=A0A840KEM3_9FLAO|nr:hypothetical protein [Chryseobacterium defluvii]MBB4805993.1 hypothetical protein [Chryseobacterium defluvii]
MKFSRENWNLSEYENWLDADFEKIRDFNLTEPTIECLLKGFPEDAAPFINFYGEDNFLELQYVSDFHELNSENMNNFVIFGSDGSGNPIGLDKAHKDAVKLIDLDNDLKIITINEDLCEFLECLITYRNFINKVNDLHGENAFFEDRYSLEDIEGLKTEFVAINAKLPERSDFWKNEIALLIANKGL